MSDIDIHHLSAAYALDALDDRERMAFEAHYPSCEVCRTDVIDFRATITHLAHASSTSPPAGLKANVMAEIAQTRQLSPLLPEVVIDLAERRRRRLRWTGGALSVAAAAVAFVAGTAVVDRNDQPAYADALSTILQQGDARVVTLAASGGAVGSIKVAWSETIDEGVLLADGLPAAPSGHAYELWMIGVDGPVAMHLLDPAAGGELRAVMPVNASPDAWGITIEPSAGSETPTGEVLYLAEA